MKALQLTGIRSMDTRELPEPNIETVTDVKVRVEAVGICGSDLHYFNHGGIGRNRVDFPFTIGHEGAGTVEAVGSAVRTVKPGDRVAIEPTVSCGTCDLCREGRENLCRNQQFLSCPGQAPGCFAEYVVVPERNVEPVPVNFSPELAALLEPLAIGVYASRCATPLSGKPILIHGAGSIGLSVLVAALDAGSGPVTVIEPVTERRAAALTMGAQHVFAPGDPALARLYPMGCEPHLAFECCGEQSALDSAIALLRPGGRLFILGIPIAERISFDTDLMRRKEIIVHYVRRQNRSLHDAIALATRRQDRLQRMITHRFSLEDGARGFELLADYKDGIIKGMIMPGGKDRL